MAIVRVEATQLDQLSEESLARLAALRDRPVDTSDIPESTPEELREIARQLREKRKKQMFSLRLEIATIQWWKNLGEGYTSVMARLLEEATRHPDWVRQCLSQPFGAIRKSGVQPDDIINFLSNEPRRPNKLTLKDSVSDHRSAL